jgi:hypothetical protein
MLAGVTGASKTCIEHFEASQDVYRTGGEKERNHGEVSFRSVLQNWREEEGSGWLHQPPREFGIELVMMRGVGRWNSKEEEGSGGYTNHIERLGLNL